MEEDKGKKKHRYTYYTATGKEEIEVDENWYGILHQADRDMYHNNRREEYKSYKYMTTEHKITGDGSTGYTMLEYLQKCTGVFNKNGIEKVASLWIFIYKQ